MFTAKKPIEKTKYSRHETVLKIGRHAKAIALQTPHLGQKLKLQKNMSKCIMQIIMRCSVQKKLSRNETILKIDIKQRL